jgi:hypothetical protein
MLKLLNLERFLFDRMSPFGRKGLPERRASKLTRRAGLSLCLSIGFSKSRFPLLGPMLYNISRTDWAFALDPMRGFHAPCALCGPRGGTDNSPFSARKKGRAREHCLFLPKVFQEGSNFKAIPLMQ